MKKTRRTPANPFPALKWMDIQEWVGAKTLSRGKSYQRSGRVHDLGITTGYDIVAWVNGSARYATWVTFKRGRLSASCTCPYGTDCKHGVATVIQYLEAVRQKEEVPVISGKDERFALITRGKTAWPGDFDADEDEDLNGEEAAGPDRDDALTVFLKGKSHSDLAGAIRRIVEEHPEIRAQLHFDARMSSSSAKIIVKTVRAEIRSASSEPGWQNWGGGGYTPDYTRVTSGLQKLYDMREFDAMVELGRELYSKGMSQAEQSNDEGETIEEVTVPLNLIYKALRRCSMPDPDKIEQAIDWELGDGFTLTEGLESFWNKKFARKHWSVVADRFLKRLEKSRPDSEDTEEDASHYERDRLVDQILRALERAGRVDEKVRLCLDEAPLTGSYGRAVTQLRDLGRDDEAREWILKGITATGEKHPGIVSDLRRHLFEIHAQRRDWPFCAAVQAGEFFESPSINGYEKLKHAGEKAKLWKSIRPFIISFLNTGKQPGSDWPLPHPGFTLRAGYSRPPFTTVLIEIALREKDLEEALRLYDTEDRRSLRILKYHIGGGIDTEIAEAVMNKYPERAIAIWKRIAEGHIDLTKPKGYAVALGYLKRIGIVMKKTGKEDAFRRYVIDLRTRNARKTRLVEMLDSFEGKRIADR